MDDTECASVVTGFICAEMGVTMLAPTPVAVAPMSTILSAYLDSGILPVYTSKNESIGKAGLPSRSLWKYVYIWPYASVGIVLPPTLTLRPASALMSFAVRFRLFAAIMSENDGNAWP